MTTPVDVVKAYLFKRGYPSPASTFGVRRLAKEAKVDPALIYQIFAGRRRMTRRVMRRIARVLDIDYAKLYLLDDVIRGRKPKERFCEAMEFFEEDLNGWKVFLEHPIK
jgi:transcriptional regulator with XRE-family HTH domain